MKNVTTLLLAISLFYGFSLPAQTKGLYFTKVTTITSLSMPYEMQSGYLYEVNDSTIVLAKTNSQIRRIVEKKMRDGDFQKIILRYSNIEKISCKRLNRGRFLKLFIAGIATTLIITAITYTPPDLCFSACGGSLPTKSDNSILIISPFLISIPLGVFSGSRPNNIEKIYENYYNFDKSKNELQKISYIQMYGE